jgi:hypothetical protein
MYHGSDNPALLLTPTKTDSGYHVGAGPVEFLGPSFSDSKRIASSYGKYIYVATFEPVKPKQFKSMESLRRDIEKSFGRLTPGDHVSNLGRYYRDIAENYRIKLTSEGFDAVMFAEGEKSNPSRDMGMTVIPITEPTPSLKLLEGKR